MQKTPDLAQFLRERRELSGLSQKAVAETLGYSTPQFISNWERGLSSPPAKSLKQLAELYQVPMDDLFEMILQTTLQQVASELKKKVYGKKSAV